LEKKKTIFGKSTSSFYQRIGIVDKILSTIVENILMRWVVVGMFLMVLVL